MQKTNINHTKISDSGYIVGNTLEEDTNKIELKIDGYSISFFNIEFDSRVIYESYQFICSKDNVLDIPLNKFVGKGKERDYPYNIDKIKVIEFNNCKFTENVYFNIPDNCTLRIENCIFEKNFNINKATHSQQATNRTINIEELIIDNCIFKDNFLFEHCIVKDYRIIDIEFENNAKIFNIKFHEMLKNAKDEEEAWFTNTIFNKSAVFEKVIFNKFIKFKHTTFKEYTLFRDIAFKEGLDLDYTSIEKRINFYNLQGLNTEESIQKTSMETYRIIKYNFEQICNYIEAHKYYMLEMNKYQDAIAKKNIEEEIVFAFNNAVSNFGQSWIRPLMIYLVIGFTFTFFISDFTIDECFYKLLTDVYNPLDKTIIEKYNIIGLVYKVFSGLILYHLIISLKRQTKR